MRLKGVPVRVVVVSHDTVSRALGQGIPFDEAVVIVHGLGRIGLGRDPDANCGYIAEGSPIRGLVRERIIAVVVLLRHVGKTAIVVEGERCTIPGQVDELRRDAIPVRVGVVGQHARRADVQRLILIDDIVQVIVGHRRIVHRKDGDVYIRCLTSVAGIASFITKGIRAVEVPAWGVSETAVLLEIDSTVRGEGG